MVTRVFADANVLYSRTLRDWLLMLKLETGGDLFSLHTTEDVIAEVLYQLRRRHPRWDGSKIVAARRHIVDSVDEVLEDFAGDIPLPFRDPDDRHIHAAAVAAGSDVLVTEDRGFLDEPVDVIDGLPYEILSADNFFVRVDDAAPTAAVDVTRQQVRYAVRRGWGPVDDALVAAGCPTFAQRVGQYAERISGTDQ